MKINYLLVLWSTAILLGVSVGFLAYHDRYQQTHFTCQNEITIFNQHIKMTSDNTIQFDGSKGSYTATGTFSSDGQNSQKFDNMFGFDFLMPENKVIIMANGEGHHSYSYKHIPLYLPDVIFHQDMAIVLNIVKINPSAHLLLRDDVPIFYCKKIR